MNPPAVPGGDLFPGQALPVEDLIAGLTAVGKDDPGMASVYEHGVIIEFFEWIQDGHQDPRGLASHALRVMRTSFERW